MFSKVIKKLVAGVTTVVLFVTCIGMFDVRTFAASMYSESAYMDMIEQYYDFINSGYAERINEIYGTRLNEYCKGFLNNSDYKEDGEGVFGIETVAVLQVVPLTNYDSLMIEGYVYSDVHTYLVKCDMAVDESDSFYMEGTNYFKFYVGVESNSLRIIDVIVPNKKEILDCDSSQDAIEYLEDRYEIIYGTSNQLTRGLDTPVYVGEISNPSTIKVLLTSGSIVTVDFRTYCKKVAYSEIRGLQTDDGLKACSMAIKMYAHQKILYRSAAGLSYHITDTEQVYRASNPSFVATDDAVDAIFDYFLLDSYGCVFPTFYRSDRNVADGQYVYKNKGILSQLEADSLGDLNYYTWQRILSYYYTRVPGTEYYNTEMSYGSVIVTPAHSHWYSYEEVCIVCGAKE